MADVSAPFTQNGASFFNIQSVGITKLCPVVIAVL